jgi:signal transduction histidine kinase
MVENETPLSHSRRWIGLILLVWIFGSLGVSWGIIHNVYQRDQISRFKMMARDLRGDVLSWPRPRHDIFHSYLTWAQSVMPLVYRQQRDFSNLAYLLVWKASGEVVLLARSKPGHPMILDAGLIDHSLDPAVWPSPLNQGLVHIRQVRKLPWTSGPGGWINVTVPLTWNAQNTGFLSFGFRNFHPWWAFWQAQRPALLSALGATLLGGILIVLLSWWVMHRLEQAGLRYAQTLRARTSLLSERGMLASVLAHEVRSPLTALGFNLHFLRSLVTAERADPARQLDLIRVCESEIRRLDLMLDDFLTRTQVIGPPQETPLNNLVNEALDFLASALEKQSIRTIRYLSPANPRVYINADELRQVLLNLCANAQDAMPHGGTLVVSIVNEADSAVLLVRDSGVGIPPEVQARLFEPFFSTKPRGSGLGLALVRRVISGAGGKIFCQSEPGKGTTFRVVLPRVGGGSGPAGVGGAATMALEQATMAMGSREMPEMVENQPPEPAPPPDSEPGR